MKKLAIIYWSGTGNTEEMAEAIADGAKTAELSVQVIPVEKASLTDVTAADAVALGCPSMGDEVLEESSMEPFMADLDKENALAEKPVALFGSYDWGSGAWMEDWSKRVTGKQAHLIQAGLIVRNTPDAAALARCRELGQALAQAL